jgi:membrane protein DedA with SNARE-associated domain
MEQLVLAWITHYGCVAIFFLLVLGIVGLPVPDETLLTFAGYLVFRGHLSMPGAFLAALAGSACGITLSYALGRYFGMALVHRYGARFRIREEHINRAHAWFNKVGHWALTFGYFVPGVRHFTAYAAGISEVEPHQFALFAYSGAALWVTTFLSVGYFLGERWQVVQRNLDHGFVVAGLVIAVVAGLWWLLRRRRQQR